MRLHLNFGVTILGVWLSVKLVAQLVDLPLEIQENHECRIVAKMALRKKFKSETSTLTKKLACYRMDFACTLVKSAGMTVVGFPCKRSKRDPCCRRFSSRFSNDCNKKRTRFTPTSFDPGEGAVGSGAKNHGSNTKTGYTWLAPFHTHHHTHNSPQSATKQ